MTAIAKPAASIAATPAASRTHLMLQGPLVPTLLRLATPNVVGLFAMTVVIGYDGYIIGRLGADALAGVALVFPLSMLMMQMSGGGIGGAVTAAVARALGAGRAEEAGRLAQQSLFIACVLAAAFTATLLGFGRGIFAAMGGRGAALEAALSYANVLFSGAIVIWATNVLGAVVRGAGNMGLPALMLVVTAVIHLVLCPLLVFGWGPIPGLGVAGAAASLLVANGTAAAALCMHLLRPGAPAPLNGSRWRLHGALLRDILRVGVPASMSPIVSNGSIAVATAFVGGYGTAALAGYGVAARLEYILVPIAFGFGTALTAIVATNMGAGNPARAHRAAWLGEASSPGSPAPSGSPQRSPRRCG
jgi:putative MATE family efflux protein